VVHLRVRLEQFDCMQQSFAEPWLGTALYWRILG